MELDNLEKIRFSGLGGTKSIDGFRSDNNIARVGKDYVNYTLTLFIIVDQEFNISAHVGIPVNGIIGYHFFKDHPVLIDYSSKKITIYNDEELFKKKIKKLKGYQDIQPFHEGVAAYKRLSDDNKMRFGFMKNWLNLH